MENKIKDEIGDSYIQIADDFFIGPMKKEEVSESMIYINHSCNPNAGVLGNIIFIAMRDIRLGEEITIDYAMIEDSPEYGFKCNCQSENCRKKITGKDWKINALQKKYKGYFSSFIQRKIKII